MNESTKFYGIDISKDVFDVTDQNDIHHQFSNDYKVLKSSTSYWTKIVTV